MLYVSKPSKGFESVEGNRITFTLVFLKFPSRLPIFPLPCPLPHKKSSVQTLLYHEVKKFVMLCISRSELKLMPKVLCVKGKDHFKDIVFVANNMNDECKYRAVPWAQSLK